MNTTHHTGQSDIAIIGMAARLPGANSLHQFWLNLRDGVDSVQTFEPEEVQSSSLRPLDVLDPGYVRAGGILDGIDLFDAPFFGFSPREAEISDPQHRLFMECVWEALESAGYDSFQYNGLIGIYASAGTSAYLTNNLLFNSEILKYQDPFQLRFANAPDFLATRVAFALNLKGPAVSVQTACSSSLVAVHLAAQSLLQRECDMAMAGGASVHVPERAGYISKPGGIVSSDGKTRTFDIDAEGTIFTPGVGVIVLKRLADALAEGDTIRAVLKGTAVNNDGASKSGYTAPSAEGQAEVLRRSLFEAGISPETISYIEAHGTATATGDPIEVDALTRVFGKTAKRKPYCALGSVKTNIGHTNVTSGVVGLIKVVLSMEHQAIPPTLNFTHLNPAIDITDSPFYINTKLSPWLVDGYPRRAGVASFGIGGTNAYTILEEAPAQKPTSPGKGKQLFILSAKTDTALKAASEIWADWLARNRDVNLADVCHTLQVGRKGMRNRQAILSGSSGEVIDILRGVYPERILSGRAAKQDRPVVFMFPGLGSEHVNMAREIYQNETVFRETFNRCCDQVIAESGFDLREVVFPSSGDKHAAAVKLKRPLLSYPANFITSYSLARLWIGWGVCPKAVLGYSSGEIAAACVTGVLSETDALKLVMARSRFSETLPTGGMLAVSMGADQIAEHLQSELSVAIDNGPRHCIVSGKPEPLAELMLKLRNLRVAFIQVPIARAYHSAMLDPSIPQLKNIISSLKLNVPTIPFASCNLGRWAEEGELKSPEYWSWQFRNPVKFYPALKSVMDLDNPILLEVGPGQTLTDSIRRNTSGAISAKILSSSPNVSAEQPTDETALSTLAKLWLHGVNVNWAGLHSGERRRRIPLPTYPFDRRHYWVEPTFNSIENLYRLTQDGRKLDIADWFYVPSWKRAPLVINPDSTANDSTYLVLAEKSGFGSDLAELLRDIGCKVITAWAGAEFYRNSDQEFTINPRIEKDYEKLLDALLSERVIPSNVIHTWSILPPEDSSSLDIFNLFQEIGYYSLISLAKTIGRRMTLNDSQLVIVTTGIQLVTGHEKLQPALATLLGLSKVIPQEYPGLVCRSIDLDIDEAKSAQRDNLVKKVIDEITSKSEEVEIALRGAYRWLKTFEPLKVNSPANKALLLRQGGVYLITGGLGDIGLALADYLAEEFNAKLVLVGRSDMPERTSWDDWLKIHAGDEIITRRIQRVRQLEDRGFAVMVATANVADRKQMAAVVEAASKQFGMIHGVFHAAGVLSRGAFSTIDSLERSQSETQFEAKAAGLFMLEDVFKDQPIDFFMLFSSISSVLGGLGYGPYAAANAFMDVHAQERSRSSKTPMISVNWDSWNFKGIDTNIGATIAEYALTAKEGIEAFRRIFAMSDVEQVIVSTGDLNRRIRTWTPNPRIEDETNIAGPIGTLHPRPELLNPYLPPTTESQKNIVKIWQELLGIDLIGIHDNFFELGGHSLLGVQMISRLRKAFGYMIPIKALFDLETVAALADYLNSGNDLYIMPEEETALFSEIEKLTEEEAKRLLMDKSS